MRFGETSIRRAFHRKKVCSGNCAFMKMPYHELSISELSVVKMSSWNCLWGKSPSLKCLRNVNFYELQFLSGLHVSGKIMEK